MIGLTLAVDPDFITLFVVIIFHRMFEILMLCNTFLTLIMQNYLKVSELVPVSLILNFQTVYFGSECLEVFCMVLLRP